MKVYTVQFGTTAPRLQQYKVNSKTIIDRDDLRYVMNPKKSRKKNFIKIRR